MEGNVSFVGTKENLVTSCSDVSPFLVQAQNSPAGWQPPKEAEQASAQESPPLTAIFPCDSSLTLLISALEALPLLSPHQ